VNSMQTARYDIRRRLKVCKLSKFGQLDIPTVEARLIDRYVNHNSDIGVVDGF
jgi:hypothetical protein